MTTVLLLVVLGLALDLIEIEVVARAKDREGWISGRYGNRIYYRKRR